LFKREKAVDIGVYSLDSLTQARGFFLPGISAPPLYLGQDYEQPGRMVLVRNVAGSG